MSWLQVWLGEAVTRAQASQIKTRKDLIDRQSRLLSNVPGRCYVGALMALFVSSLPKWHLPTLNLAPLRTTTS